MIYTIGDIKYEKHNVRVINRNENDIDKKKEDWIR